MDGHQALICSAIANPDDVTFVWKKLEDNYTEDAKPSMETKLKSYVVLDRSFHMLRTYICYTNNSVGESVPCEIQVPGELKETAHLFIKLFLIRFGSKPCINKLLVN